ncbi:MAG: DUF6263 family protein [Leptolyngbyaceae cyanobacterium bins.302]|nr:DUF6263 family protein [Leptolyngbyaceae cyanobacterium bins.302]
MKTVLLASLLLSFVGWGEVLSETTIAQAAPLFTAQQRSTTDPVTPTTTPIQVKLLDPGTGDRQVLRFKPAVGTRQVSLMTFEQAMTISMMGQPIPALDLPIVNTTIEVVVTKVEENGDIHYQFTYPEVEVVAKPGAPSTLVEATRSQLKKLQNTRGNFVMNSRGQIQSGRFELPDNLDPLMRQTFEQLSQSLNQLSFPLPEEAVGIGAKWQTTAPIAIAGMSLTQTGTYELVSFDNNTATLNIQVNQAAAPQSIGLPGIPASARIQLKKLQTEGQGRSVLDLTKPFVLQSTLSMQSASQMSFRNPGSNQETAMTTQATVQIKFQPK